MATEQYPAECPQHPMRDGFSVDFVDNVARAPVDQGPAKQRPRSTGDLAKISCQVYMTADEAAVFEHWQRVTLAKAALRFEWPALASRLIGPYGDMQFTEKPKWQPAGPEDDGRNSVIWSLQIMARQQASGDQP